MTKLFVGGLPFDLNEQDLRGVFEEYGPIISAKIIIDRETNRSRGFAFIELKDAEKANLAISEMNGGMIEDKKIVVSIANPIGSGGSTGRNNSTHGAYNNQRSGGYNRNNPNTGYSKGKSSSRNYRGGPNS